MMCLDSNGSNGLKYLVKQVKNHAKFIFDAYNFLTIFQTNYIIFEIIETYVGIFNILIMNKNLWTKGVSSQRQLDLFRPAQNYPF